MCVLECFGDKLGLGDNEWILKRITTNIKNKLKR